MPCRILDNVHLFRLYVSFHDEQHDLMLWMLRHSYEIAHMDMDIYSSLVLVQYCWELSVAQQMPRKISMRSWTRLALALAPLWWVPWDRLLWIELAFFLETVLVALVQSSSLDPWMVWYQLAMVDSSTKGLVVEEFHMVRDSSHSCKLAWLVMESSPYYCLIWLTMMNRTSTMEEIQQKRLMIYEIEVVETDLVVQVLVRMLSIRQSTVVL